MRAGNNEWPQWVRRLLAVPRMTGVGASRSLSLCSWNGSSCPKGTGAGGLKRLRQVGKRTFVPRHDVIMYPVAATGRRRSFRELALTLASI